jgi:8-oxo-dGTP diphosphatase
MVDEEMDVVAAAIINDGKVLITQRKTGSHMADKWELPGGKVEKGEKPQQAVVREIREELGFEVQAERIFNRDEHIYNVDGKKRRVKLITFLCSIQSGEPKCIGCQSFRWIRPQELKKYDFADADKDVIEKIARRSQF